MDKKFTNDDLPVNHRTEDRIPNNESDAVSAWMVRGGSDGEREAVALNENIVIAGWDKLGNLGHCHNKEELRQKLKVAYPEESKATISNWTGQLWRFSHEIRENDFVVMPLKTRHQRIAIGRVAGPYEFRSESPSGFQHVLPLEWIQTDIRRTELQQDLLNTMGSLLTVCQLKRYGATRRIAHLAKAGTDPGPSPDELPQRGVNTPQELLEKAMARDPHDPFRITIRELLACWDAVRRTPAIVAQIETDLAEKGLTTRPPFTERWIDNEVEIVAVGEEPGEKTRSTEPELAMHTEDISEFPAITLRVGVLESANTGVVAVRPDDDLLTAVTKMVDDNYSQLAVIDEEGTLHGAISWESIGKARVSGSVSRVSDALVTARVVNYDEDLLSQIEEIYRGGYVFVMGPNRAADGVVTASDLTIQFGDLARPFVLVEEAERRLRRRVDEVFTVDELKRFAVGRRPVTSAADLTIGNYQRLLGPVDHWQRLDWALDHEHFLRRLEEVRKIRNELMHFTPDPLNKTQLSRVEGFVRLLRTVDPRD